MEPGAWDEAARARYRQALGCFTTGVALITVADGERTVGLTVNSFTSLSLDPPLVLWCLGKASDRGVWFLASDRFVVNILGADDADLARTCARRGAYFVDPGRIERGPDGDPAVRGALARLHCRHRERITVGDHLILVGETVDFDSRPGDGLTYFRGRWGRAEDGEA